jgi:hypothetical protein
MSTPPMPPAGPGGPQQPQGQPYSQQPQGQQPYPQQPQGQPYPQAPQGQFAGGPVPGTGPMPQQGNFPPGQPQPFPQAPMGTPPKKGRKLLASIGGVVGVIVVVIIVRLVIGVGVSTVASSTDDAHNTAVGECASVTGTTSKPNYEKVDCGSGKENYQVGVVLKSTETCPDGYDEYYETGTLNNVKLCLAPVLTDGKCYNFQSTLQTEMGYKAIPCTDPNATQVKLLKGATDSKTCPEPDRAMVFAPLKTVYCAVEPSGS